MATILINVELNTYTCYEGHTYATQKVACHVDCPYCLTKDKDRLINERNKLYIKVNQLERKLKRAITF